MNECEVGKIYFIAEENSLEKELRLYQIESDVKDGSGLFHKQGIRGNLDSKDFKLSFSDVDGGQLTSQVMIGTLAALCLGATGKVSMVFYSSLDDMIIKALNISQD